MPPASVGGDAHRARLLAQHQDSQRERADRTTPEFYADATVGEFWIGPRPALEGVASGLGIATAHLDAFESREGDVVLDEDDALTGFVSELRLVKDEYEIEQMRLAVEVTGRGFDDIVADLEKGFAAARG